MTVSKLPRGNISEARKHELFLSSREKKYATPLNEFTLDREMVKLVCVPGNKHHLMVHREGTEFALDTTSAIMEWMLKLHSIGLSFDGNFTSRDLYVAASGQIKMKASKRRFLIQSTEGKKLDRQQIAEIIEAMLCGVTVVPETLPHDISHLLEILRDGKNRDDIVLQKHPGPMRGIEKLALFILLFAQMQSFEQRDPEMYKRIVQSLPFGNSEWITRINPLKFLMKIFNYKGRSKSYPLDASGMLLLQRNGLAHLIKDHSIKVRVRRLKVKGLKTTKRVVNVHFTYNQISYMYSFACPQLIAKLQLSLHREGEFRSIYKAE